MKNWTWILLITVVFSGCQFTGSGTTGGSETTNGLSGIIEDVQGKPISNATVFLIPEDYIPIRSKDSRTFRRASTNKNGFYAFEKIAEGKYNLEGKDSLKNTLALITHIHIDSNSPLKQTSNGILQPSGELAIALTDRHLPENTQVFIPGTSYSTLLSSNLGMDGILILKNIAPSTYSYLMIYSPDIANGTPIPLVENFSIQPNKRTQIPWNAAWRYQKIIKVNLSQITSGSDERVYAYPLLLRLRTENFDFSQTQSDGKDIRFSDKNGNKIPFQIEKWDAVNKAASIWVRTDSLTMGAIDSSIIMHWGRNDANEFLQSEKVFDSTNAISTVWHFSESPNNLNEGYKDASKYKNHATAAALNLSSTQKANISDGYGFSKDGDYLTSKLPYGFGDNASFSVSFWMNFSLPASFQRQAILFFGKPGKFQGIHFLIRKDTTAQFGPWDVAPDTIESPSLQQNHFSLVPYLGKWSHVTTVYNAEKGTLSTYINGELKAQNNLTGLSISNTSGVSVGLHITGNLPSNDYKGMLDEIRFYRRSLSDTWIRLEYETQKEGSLLFSP